MGADRHDGSERQRRGVTRRGFLKGAAIGTGVAAADLGFLTSFASAATSPVVTENALGGSPPSEWDLVLDPSIEGFPTEYSVNAGSPVHFKIKTPSTNYRIDIYRMGWYQGNGARKVATIQPSVTLPQTQPEPFSDPETGLVDCGNWAVSATWNVPANAVSGIYYANLVRLDAPGENRIQFVVRNDGRVADILLQTPDMTYQAYNTWGGYSLYEGANSLGRATKVSYNRPIPPRKVETDFFYADYPLVRFLERNGFDVAYCSGIDTDRQAGELLNKKVFISTGHDEYWSGAQRANVEAARDAGVNLIFMTGNEVFWKTRWEPSVDGTATPYKTLVCYKETHADAKIDPSPEWTGTWRDPRFTPPSNGGRPENALTGQLFRGINPVAATDFAIKVPYAYSRFRIWRNTTVAALQAGQTSTLALQTLGFEWDADVDNGFRPAGLIRLSQTTETCDGVLQDHGSTYTTAPLTHHLTMYRAPSGALVFGTGTCQWSWGLDDYHLVNPGPVPVPVLRMQQPTVNVLADMGVQPATRQSGIVAATKSTDTMPPVTTITGPAPGASFQIGSTITVSGTATDAGGGQVAGIEVSTDGGARWHPATGTGSWSYTFRLMTLGTTTIRVRAVDDSCNLESPGPSRVITGTPRTFPCSIWPTGTVPSVASTADATPLELGVKFRSAVDGFVTGIRFYKGAGNTGTHVGHLWSATGALLGAVTFSGETASGWQTATFSQPIPVIAGVTYVASYFAPSGRYASDINYFASAFDLPPLRALASGEDGPNGVFRVGSAGFPADTFGATNYWVDIVFDIDDHRAPTVIDRSPAPGIEAVALNTTVAATFSEPMDGPTVAFELRNPANALVAGTAAYDSPTRRLTFTPTAALAPRTTYTAKVLSGKDKSGAAMAAPATWTFTTTATAGDVPTSLWDSSAVPAVGSADDPANVEVGVRFRSDVDGAITAIRFYKGTANLGTHVGHLWTAGGALLGTVTFANETVSGWQQANFTSPVPVQKNTAYIASYLAPVGGYALSPGYFTSSVDRGPLHAPAEGAAGPNGVFQYGGGFPSEGFNASNYWVDVMFAVPPDTFAPTVIDRSPAPDIDAVSPSTTVRAEFNEPINQASLVFTLRSPTGVQVPAAVTYDAASRTATLTPTSPLASATKYTASVTAADTLGNAMAAPHTWTFTTATATGQIPATIWDTSALPGVPAADDDRAIEVGLKFRSDVAGAVRGVRFYKGPGNTGTHIGHLWTATGTLLGSVTFANETARGWQQANFAAPVPITGGTTYVVSYHTSSGHYSATPGAFVAAGVDRAPLHALRSGVDGGNGVFVYGPGGFPAEAFDSTNYWVDLVLVETVGPTVVGRTPTPGATGVPRNVRPTATFSEDVQPATITFQLRDNFGSLVAASVGYNASTRTATLTPNSRLLPLVRYTATVSGARDLSDNAMAAPVSWTFTTALN